MSKITEELKIYTEGNPSNQAIIFIHGFPYDSSMWKKQVEELKDNYYCVSYDIRGLGKSSVGSGQFTMETFVDDVFAIVEELKLDKPVLCGLSMGGYMSFRILERDQSKFRGVIFCDTKPEADDNPNKLRRSASIKRIETEGLEKFVKDFIPNCFSIGYIKNNSREYNYIIEKAALASPVGVKGAQLAMLSRTDSSEFIKEIKIPALVLCGEFDKMTTPDQMKKVAEAIPGSEFRIIPDSGHMTPIENPAEFNKAVLSFLSKI
jgi:pimeloyl-ACP methyl ester carboxylesterase